MTTPTGRVAFTVSLPVDVLMKSAPAIMATWLARATFTSVARSPVPRITFMWASPQASRKARTSSYSASHAPASACARVITTSISCATAATEALISSIRWGRGFNPAGNPVDTAATGIAESCKASTASGTKAWYTHTAPTVIPMSVAPRAASRSGRTGLFALAHRRSTLVGVSSPWIVVRSMHVMARSSHAACHSFLTVRRVGIVAVRRSTALRLMRSARTRSRSRGIPGLRSGSVNTRSARSGETTAGIVPAAGVGCSYRRLVSITASNLRRLFLLRRVPLGLTLLPGPLVGCRSARRLLSLRRRRLLLFGGRWSRRPFRRLRLLRRLQRFRRLRALPGLRPRRDPFTCGAQRGGRGGGGGGGGAFGGRRDGRPHQGLYTRRGRAGPERANGGVVERPAGSSTQGLLPHRERNRRRRRLTLHHDLTRRDRRGRAPHRDDRGLPQHAAAARCYRRRGADDARPVEPVARHHEHALAHGARTHERLARHDGHPVPLAAVPVVDIRDVDVRHGDVGDVYVRHVHVADVGVAHAIRGHVRLFRREREPRYAAAAGDREAPV